MEVEARKIERSVMCVRISLVAKDNYHDNWATRRRDSRPEEAMLILARQSWVTLFMRIGLSWISSSVAPWSWSSGP